MSSFATEKAYAIWFIEEAKKQGSFCFDVEHNPEVGPHTPGFELHGCGFAIENEQYYCTDVSLISMICESLFDTDTEAIAYNAKYDCKCLVAGNAIEIYKYPKNLVDPMVGINLLDENRRGAKLGLKSVVLDYTGKQMRKFDDAWGKPDFSKCAGMFWKFGFSIRVRPVTLTIQQVG